MSGHRFRAQAAIFILALTAAAGLSCSSLATIERRSGRTMEARIDGSDGELLYVTDGENGRYVIERTDIVEIHHPGRPAITTGAILLGGGAFAFVLAPVFDHANERFLEVMALAYGIGLVAAGLPLLLYGAGTNMRSHEAAKVRLRASPQATQELPRLSCPSCR